MGNAVILNDGVTKDVGDKIDETEIALWYVWIPRYKYTIFNGNNGSAVVETINIQFEEGTETTGTVSCTDSIATSGNSSETCKDETNGSIRNGISTYTHPAFTFGTNEDGSKNELTGFWVGKFENSTTNATCNNSPSETNCNNTNGEIRILPNKDAWRYASVSTYYDSINNINITNGDSHMMKNMEWGAVTYLSHSKYGINGEITLNNVRTSSSPYTLTHRRSWKNRNLAHYRGPKK